MNRTLNVLILLSGLASLACASEISVIEDKDADLRQFTSSTLQITSSVASYYIFCAAATIAAILLFLSFFYSASAGGESGYSSSGYGDDSGSTYSSYGRKSFNAYDSVNWEQFTILDFIAIAEEAYRKFNPADLECQKRLICEVHQNTSKFGFAARKMVDVFSYLQYIEVLNLPEEFKALAEEYLDAADRGRNMTKECGEVYNTCEFSVKQITDKFSHNEIK